MRRRTAPVPTSTDTPPAELLVGALAEVWAPGDLLAARRRWNDARTEWLQARGLDVASGCRVIPAGVAVEPRRDAGRRARGLG